MIATSPALLTFDRSADGVSVDLDTLVTSRLLLQANSGGGKSWMLELFAARHCAARAFVCQTAPEHGVLPADEP